MRNAIYRGVILAISVWITTGCVEKSVAPRRVGPKYYARKTAEPPVIDGVLNDTSWGIAETGQLLLSRNGGRPTYPTTIRAVWDDEYLFIGFECQDTDAASTVKVRDGPVSSAEYISVFIDANADSVSYIIIEAAPTGVVFDAFVLNREESLRKKILSDWNCEGLRISVSVYGGGAKPGTVDRFWTVEMAIPFKELLQAQRIPPQAGDMWRVNFYRMELTGNIHFSAFASTGSDDGHKPARFAWLEFGG